MVSGPEPPLLPPRLEARARAIAERCRWRPRADCERLLRQAVDLDGDPLAQLAYDAVLRHLDALDRAAGHG